MSRFNSILSRLWFPVKKIVKNENNFFIIIAYCLSIILFLISFIIVGNDNNFAHRWLAFSIHISAFFLIIFLSIVQSINKKIIHKFFGFKEIGLFCLVLVIADLISFFNLVNYPFVSIFDEVRDGGLDAMNIAKGSMLNIFYYGRYEAHGLIIPTISSFFYNIFGSSVLTYRFPSAILSCLDIAAIYILVRLLTNKTAAFFSAFVLASLPLHIFFTRTQIVVSFSTFWTSIILLVLYVLLRKHRNIDYILLGTILGFSFGFHAAIRVVAILVLLVIILIKSWKIFWGIIKHHNIYEHLLNLLLIALFCFLGFGPRIIYSNVDNFFHTSRLTATSTVDDQKNIKENYLKSLMVWFYEPTTYFYADHKPILPPFLAVFFLIGLGFMVFIQKKVFSYILIFLAFAIPFFSSAITDLINADHRIVTLLPIGAILVGSGIAYIIFEIRYKLIRYLVIIFICGYLILQTLIFFGDQPANKNYKIQDYLSMHIIQFLKSRHDPVQKEYCEYVSPSNYNNLNLPHYIEQYEYFLPDIKVHANSNEKVKDNEVYIFKNTCPQNYQINTRIRIISCSKLSNSLFCPLDYKDDMIIHY